MTRGGRRSLAALLALLLAQDAAAQSRVPDDEHAAWRAVGRVNVGGYGARSSCTGTLIAPDLVLTAAHCIPPRALRASRPEPVHFVAGWLRGKYAAHRLAREIRLHPDAAPGGATAVSDLASDVALLVLEAPIDGETVAPLPLTVPASLDDLSILAYGVTRQGALSRIGPCRGDELGPHLLALDCAVVGGNSGAPVLAPGDGGLGVAAVVVAAAAPGAGFHSIAVRPNEDLLRPDARP